MCNDFDVLEIFPPGCANKSWKQIGYTPEEFLDFYKRALLRIISKNARTVICARVMLLFSSRKYSTADP